MERYYNPKVDMAEYYNPTFDSKIKSDYLKQKTYTADDYDDPLGFLW